jgi:hypothetical protein
MSNKTLVVMSLWRNSESYLERSLKQFEAMEELLSTLGVNVVYSFFENDSEDLTPIQLMTWLRDRFGLVASERIGAPRWGSVPSLERVRYQARYRNIALAPLNTYYDYDYLLVADSDVYWEPSLIQGMIERLDNNPDWGMVSPKTTQNVRDYIGDTDKPSYFDSWSLKDLNDRQCLTFAANPFLSPEDRTAWDNNEPVACNSAFGSIAMVKADALQYIDGSFVEWDVVDGVEHWEFCAGIRSNGYKVIADPTLSAQVIHRDEVVPRPEVIQMNKDYLTWSQR